MNWKKSLYKPKWQHKSADIRLESVTIEQHPELISSLVEIAGTDEDKRVRCAAIKRLHQLENILNLYGNESDQTVRELLESRIHQLAASSNESRPALEFRLRVVEITSDRELIEHLAVHAPETELRRAALAKVERQGVLGDCCINDSDAKNRSYAASRISQHTSLKRVINGLRKRDKALYTKLQARLQQELLNQADPKAVQAEAILICAALEKLALEKQALGTDKAEISDTKSLHTAWQRIASHASTDMADRYQRICKRLAAPPVVTPAASVATVVDHKPESTAVKVASVEITESPKANETSVKSTSEIHQHETENQQRSGEELIKAQELLLQLQTELENGELQKALETRAKLQRSTKGHGKHKDWLELYSKTAGTHARLRELREWHHWSNNKVRKRLIAEMEVLPAADLHPDALLNRIKSLQVEWKTLEQSEQIPGEKHFSAAPWMWRKFSAAGHTAFETARPFLDKRSEIQSRHAKSLATFCAELKQLATAEPTDWTALSKGLNRGRKKLHDLNNVPANQRQKFARKLKNALDKANLAMQEHYRLVEIDKMKLIRAASQLIHMPDRSEAITGAKSLQANWKSAGSLWRSKEQELWLQFREHLNPLFEALKEQQESLRATDDERLSVQKRLCAEMRDILKSGDDLSVQLGKVQGLQDSWKDIGHPDRRLQKSFQGLVEDYQQRVKQLERQQVKADRERQWLKFALLHELAVTGQTAKGSLSKKTRTKVTKVWPGVSSDEAPEKAMDQACSELLAETAAESNQNEIKDLQTQARNLSIRLEFIAGLPSPDEDRDQRMQYQVDRLAESMSGINVRLPVIEEARHAEIEWFGMYALPEIEFKAFGKRIEQALSVIMENN
jgi:hypothetical protein